MTQEFVSYRVRIVEEPYAVNNDLVYEKTARVSFHDKNGNTIRYNTYGVIEPEIIYNHIDENNTIDLHNCYVKNFSLEQYRANKHIPLNETLEIASCSAVNVFFDGRLTKNFSHTKFLSDSVSFVNCIFGTGDVNFSKCEFNKCDANFSGTLFNDGFVNFQFSEFEEGNVSFEQAKFRGDGVSFVNTYFGEGKVNFRNVDFGSGNVEFHYSRFGTGDKWFDKCIFECARVDFRKVEFGNGKLEFRRTDFGDSEVIFDESEFGIGKVSFKRTKFGDGNLSFEDTIFRASEISFERSEFKSINISFLNSTVTKLILKSCPLNRYCDLRVKKADYIDLSDSIIRDMIDLMPGVTKVQVGTINLTGVRNLGRIFIDWHLNCVKELIYNQKDSSLAQKAEQFRIIKEEFHKSGQYNDEDKAYIEFKRLELKAETLQKIANKKWKAFYVKPVAFLEWLLFDIMGLYATSPLRVLNSTIVVYIIFSLIFALLPQVIDTSIESSLGDPDKLGTVAKAFYHSAITFLTIGYGDYYPSGLLRWLSNVEGFVGVFLMSYFVVAFVRKILR